jgi:K+-transporting ATPase A subunit
MTFGMTIGTWLNSLLIYIVMTLCFMQFDNCICFICDAPPNSLMDSIANLKVKTMEGEGVRVRSLAHNTSGVEGLARAPR